MDDPPPCKIQKISEGEENINGITLEEVKEHDAWRKSTSIIIDEILFSVSPENCSSLPNIIKKLEEIDSQNGSFSPTEQHSFVSALSQKGIFRSFGDRLQNDGDDAEKICILDFFLALIHVAHCACESVSEGLTRTACFSLMRQTDATLRSKVILLMEHLVSSKDEEQQGFPLVHFLVTILLSLASAEREKCLCLLENFFKLRPAMPDELNVQCCLMFRSLLQEVGTEEEILTLARVCTTFGAFSYGTNNKIQQILLSGIMPFGVSLLGHSSIKVRSGSIKLIGFLLSGDDVQTQQVLDAGVIVYFHSLLKEEPTKDFEEINMLKDAAWALSNITAGAKNQIQAVLDAKLITPLIKLLKFPFRAVQREVVWALRNAIRGGSFAQQEELLKLDLIKGFTGLLRISEDVTSMGMAVESFQLMMGEAKQNEKDKLYLPKFYESDTLEVLCTAKIKADNEIFESSCDKFLRDFFPKFYNSTFEKRTSI